MTDSSSGDSAPGRALLPAGKAKQLEKVVNPADFLPIEAVRELIHQNTIKGTGEMPSLVHTLDPELMVTIDARVDYRVFVIADNAYTRDELLKMYPFTQLGTTPEKVFDQQEVVIFTPKDATSSEELYEYIARDVGSSDVPLMAGDLVGQTTQKNYKTKHIPIKTVQTKIYLGKRAWKDFKLTKRILRSYRQFLLPQLTGNPAAVRALLGFDDKNYQNRRKAQLLLEEQAQVLERKKEQLARREKELEAREHALYRSLGIEPEPGPQQVCGEGQTFEVGGDSVSIL